MKTSRRRFSTIAIAIALLCASSFLPLSAAQGATAPTSLDDAKGRLVEFERLGLASDVDEQLDYIANADAGQGSAWSSIVDYWNGAINHFSVTGTSDPTSLNGIPDGLPNDRSHVFVVLGNKLNSDGSAQPELIDRMKVALAASQKYPNSRFLVTGGHTAGADKASEGEVMANWLAANGVAANRVIVETQSGDTPDNATLSMPMLYAMTGADKVSSISVITSQWHARRGNILFATETKLLQHSLGLSTPIQLLDGPSCATSNCSNSGYVNPPGYPNSNERNLIAQNVAKVASNVDYHAGLGSVTGVTTSYDAFRSTTDGLRSKLAKVVYLLQAGFKGDDANPRDNAADVARGIAEAGDTSATYAAELSGFADAWDAAMRPQVVSSAVPSGLPGTHHAFVMMGADGGTGAAMTNRIVIAKAALAQYPNSVIVVAGNQAEINAGYSGLTTGSGAIDPSRVTKADASTNAQSGAVNATRALYGFDGAVTSYTLIVSGNYVRRPTALFAAAGWMQRQASRADYRIVPTAAIAETVSNGSPDASLPTQGNIDQIVGNMTDIMAITNEYNTVKSAPPTLSNLTGLSVTAPTKTTYLVGEPFDPAGITVTATLDNGSSRTVDVTNVAQIPTVNTNALSSRAEEVSYTYRGVTKTATFNITVRAGDATALSDAIATAAAVDPTKVTAETYAALVTAQQAAQAVAADLASTSTQLAASLDALQAALDGLRSPAPSVSITLSATPAAGWVNSGTTATVTATPGLPENAVTNIEYSVGGAWLSYDGPVILPAGQYELSARATDSVGEVSTVQHQTVKVGPNGAPKLSAASVTTQIGTTAQLRITLQSNGTLVTSGTVTASIGTKKLGTAAVKSGVATVSLGKDLAVGKYPITLTYAPAAGTGFQTAVAANAATVTINKVNGKIVKIKRVKGKLVRGQRAVVKVTVATVNGVKPSGKVTLKVGKKTIGAATVKRSGKTYTATVRTKKLTKKGKIKAFYGGSKTYTKATKSTTLRVR